MKERIDSQKALRIFIQFLDNKSQTLYYYNSDSKVTGNCSFIWYKLPDEWTHSFMNYNMRIERKIKRKGGEQEWI